MGTSTSSSGAPSCVPFDPPWISGIADKILPDVSIESLPSSVSEPARFRDARRNLSKFISSGDRNALKRAISSYVKRGLGGARQATSRFRIPIVASVALISDLRKVIAAEENDQDQDWIQRIKDSSDPIGTLAEELSKRIIPEGGSIDEESCRKSIAYAVCEFQRENPDIDIENFVEDTIFDIAELFLLNEIYNRMLIDLGQYFERMDISKIADREDEIKVYVRSALSAQIRRLRRINASLTKTELLQLVTAIMNDTFEVFAGGDDE